MTPYAANERAMLLAYLQRQRDLIAWKVNGLPDDQARSVATPSGMTIHGIVRHLEKAERYWLLRWFAGQQGPDLDCIGESLDDDMRVPEGIALADLLANYATETRRCDEVVAAHRLDDLEATGPRTLRWILHHLIEETSRHLGHLDLLRELADGQTGEEP
jgi:uncharacterized damage-inducible protein DinB